MSKLNTVQINTLQTMTSPNPFALLVTEVDKKVNVMAVSWWTYVSNRPPMIAAALSKKGLSGESILQSKQFTLCFPSREIADAAFSCGCVSGRQTDKLANFNLKPEILVDGFPPSLEHCVAAVLCSLNQVAEAGDHTLFIANVEHVFANPDMPTLHAYSGYREIR